MKKIYAAILAASLCTGCSAIGTMLAEKALGASSNGIEATAQVGKENQKGLMNTKLDQSSETEVEIRDVAGDSNVGSGNSSSITNQGKDMFLMVMAGALAPLLLLLYFIPSPRWLARRHADFCSKEQE